MNAKKNLTVAALAALLAVPAFGITNANAESILKTPTGRLTHSYRGYPAGTIIYDGHGPGGAAGADNMENGALGHANDNTHPLVEIPAKYVARLGSNTDNWTNHVGTSMSQSLMNKVKSLGGTYDNSNDTENLYYNGHHYELTGTNTGVLIDGKPATEAQALEMLDNNGFNNGTSTDNNQSNYQNNGTNNGKLPQTNENNGASKAAALGAVAATASVGLAALSFAKKHRDMEAADLTDVISAADGKKRNKPSYSAKSSYDMIMSNTFANLSKSLKNL